MHRRRHGGESHDEHDLRGDCQGDALFDVRFGVRPLMQALERSQRLAWEACVQELDRVGQYGPARAEQDRPLALG